FVAEFGVSSAVARDPSVTARGPSGQTLEFTRTSGPDSDGRYFYLYTAGGTETEESLVVSAHTVGPFGGEANFEVGSLTLDFTPPRVLEQTASVLLQPSQSPLAQSVDRLGPNVSARVA